MMNGVSKDQAYFDMVEQQIKLLDKEIAFLHAKTVEDQIINKEKDEKMFEILDKKRTILVEVLDNE